MFTIYILIFIHFYGKLCLINLVKTSVEGGVFVDSKPTKLDTALLRNEIESLRIMAHSCTDDEFHLLQAHVEGLTAYIRCLGRGRADSRHKYDHKSSDT